MACRYVALLGGVGIVCGRDPPPKPCALPGCGRTHTRLCDAPIERKGKRTTCSMRLCDGHAHEHGDLDYCPAHHRHLAGTGPLVINRNHYAWEPGFGPRIERQTPSTRPLPSPRIYIGRGTPLGNPYTVEKHGEAALELYRVHLWKRIKANDADVLAELASITPAHHLVCSCAPRPCHGEIVVRAWEWCRDHGMLRPAR